MLGQKRLGVRVFVISLGLVNLVLEIHVQSEKYSFLGLFRSLTLTELPRGKAIWSWELRGALVFPWPPGDEASVRCPLVPSEKYCRR